MFSWRTNGTCFSPLQGAERANLVDAALLENQRDAFLPRKGAKGANLVDPVPPQNSSAGIEGAERSARPKPV
jgi:hypothetical protein